jgi:uncharacterized membrane protein
VRLRRCVFLLGVVLLLTVPLQAQTPTITGATVSYVTPAPLTNTVTITWTGFSPKGVAPTVVLDNAALAVSSFANTLIVATYSSSLPTGSYNLTVTSSQKNSVVFSFANGAVGPQGSMGLQGPKGDPGVQGFAGTPGAVGPKSS